jgi:hypothetical protein
VGAVMRRGRPWGLALLTGAALTAASLGTMAPAAPATPATRPTGAGPAARPAASGSDELSGISCTSTHYCIAVGTAHMNGLGVGTAQALAWNGRGWQVLPTPGRAGSSLAGIDCLSARRCVAVGSVGSGRETLAMRWNGRNWRRLAMPSHDGGLHAVSCTSRTRCMAVGSDHVCELAEQWNGSTWQVLSTPSPCGPPQAGGLTGVACQSAGSCQAVGSYMPDNGTALTLAESWNGRKWTQPDTSSPGDQASLNAVSCLSASNCMAVGSGLPVEVKGQTAIAESWNGHAWQLLSPARKVAPATLGGVACLRAGWCMTVGSFTRGGTLFPQAQTWNGAIWQAVPPPDAPGTLSGLSCPEQDRCLAVGASGPANFAAVWNNTRWRSLTSVPSP